MKISNNLIAVLIVLFMLSSTYANYVVVKKGTERIDMEEISGNWMAFGRIEICINRAPYIYPVPQLNASVGEDFHYWVNATDGDNDTLEFFDDTVLFDIEINNGHIHFVPTIAQVGTHTIEIIVRDGKGCLSSERTVDIHLRVLPPERHWNDIIPPEGIFDPPSGLSGTHVSTFNINFINLTVAPTDTLRCDIKQSDGSTLIVSETGVAVDEADYGLS
ncbi:hypothetical protein ACFLZ6_02040, partial [Nanoarchaeota archaeon]